MTSVFIAMIGLLGLFACGRTAQKVELKNEPLSDVSDPNCKNGSCPEVEYSLVDGSGSNIESKVYEGTVKVPVRWPVSVKSSATASRIKLALVGEKAQWIQKEASGTSGSIFIVGTPEEFTSESSISFLARDMGRCAALEKNVKDCSSPEVSFAKYDRKFKLRFKIFAGSGSRTGN
jgi:hypothetical protein